MKSALCLSLIIASANVVAQQAPAAAQERRHFIQQVPKAASTQNTQQAPRAPDNNRPRPSMAPPMAAPPQAAQPGSAERTEELLRAQTEAIRALAGKLDTLEERIGRIESRQR